MAYEITEIQMTDKQLRKRANQILFAARNARDDNQGIVADWIIRMLTFPPMRDEVMPAGS